MSDYKQQTLQEILAELRAFRATQPAHDLSVLRHRNYPKPERETIETEPPAPKKPKRGKG